MTIRRRTVLGSLVLPLVAGCGSQSSSSGPPTSSSTEREPTTDTESARTTNADGESHEPERTVIVVNDGTEDRFVTVAVEREGETVFVDSRTVRGGTSRSFEGVVPASGDYRVIVDTSNGVRGNFAWQVTDAFGELRVDLRDDVTFSQVVRCDPDCPGVALGGTSTGYPDGGFDPRGRRAGSKLRMRNDTTAERMVRVRVAEGAILDYRYRIPPSTTLVLPVPQRSGETRVDVERLDGEGRQTYQWAMENSPTLRATVGSAVRFICGERTHELQLLNEDDSPHTLDVAVTGSDGQRLFTRTYDLGIGESVREVDAVSTAGDYELALATEASSTSYEWSTCPPRGPVYVIVQADGTVTATHIVSD